MTTRHWHCHIYHVAQHNLDNSDLHVNQKLINFEAVEKIHGNKTINTRINNNVIPDNDDVSNLRISNKLFELNHNSQLLMLNISIYLLKSLLLLLLLLLEYSTSHDDLCVLNPHLSIKLLWSLNIWNRCHYWRFMITESYCKKSVIELLFRWRGCGIWRKLKNY